VRILLDRAYVPDLAYFLPQRACCRNAEGPGCSITNPKCCFLATTATIDGRACEAINSGNGRPRHRRHLQPTKSPI